MHTSSLPGLMITNIGQINLYLNFLQGTYSKLLRIERASICIDSSLTAVHQERV